jgi:hypothetical protein
VLAHLSCPSSTGGIADCPQVSGRPARQNRRVSTADPDVEHLIVAQDIFAGDRFWAALDRLAQRRGHDGHQRYLLGAAEPTNRYEFRCVSCERVIATMDVQREAGLTDRY